MLNELDVVQSMCTVSFTTVVSTISHSGDQSV
jgi:hypothetical protein